MAPTTSLAIRHPPSQYLEDAHAKGSPTKIAHLKIIASMTHREHQRLRDKREQNHKYLRCDLIAHPEDLRGGDEKLAELDKMMMSRRFVRGC